MGSELVVVKRGVSNIVGYRNSGAVVSRTTSYVVLHWELLESGEDCNYTLVYKNCLSDRGMLEER